MAYQRLSIPWPEFGNSVRTVLAGYQEDIEKAVSKEAQKAAKLTRADIQSASPKRSGTYAQTWTVRKDAADLKRPAFIVHAKKPGYQLAHLLERSHRIANQYGVYGRTAGQPHIDPAAIKNGELFQLNVARAIKDLS